MAVKNVGITFPKKVYKGDASGDVIEVGDTVSLRLYGSANAAGDNYQDVTVTAVTDGGFGIHWDFLTTNVNPLDVAGLNVSHNPLACP